MTTVQDRAASTTDSPVAPAVARGDLTAEPHYDHHDCLRRVVDLLVGDLIAWEGQVREVERIGIARSKPGICYLRLVGDLFDEHNRPIYREYGVETKARVLPQAGQAAR